MSDPTTFESRLARAIGRYADLAPMQVDAAAVAGEIASSRRGRTFAGFRLTPLLIGLLLIAAAAAAAVGSQLLLPRHIDGVFEQTGPMTEPRSHHVAVALQDGRVLIAGGCIAADCGGWHNGRLHGTPLLTAELFDPRLGTFLATGRLVHGAGIGAPLHDGRVLMLTLAEELEGFRSYAQIYDPASGQFEDLDVSAGSGGTGAFKNAPALTTRLADRRVLILENNEGLVPSAENAVIFDPASGRFEPTKEPSPIKAPRDALLLRDGRVLIVGQQFAFAAVFRPDSGAFEELATPPSWEQPPVRVAPLPDGRVLVLANRFDGPTGEPTGIDAAIFDPRTDSFEEIAPVPLSNVNDAVALRDGRVLILSGVQNVGAVPLPVAAQLYDPATGMYTALPAPLARYGPSLTLLVDGRVLIAGGDLATDAATSAAEILR